MKSSKTGRSPSFWNAFKKSWMSGEKLALRLQWKAAIPQVYHRTGMKDGAYWFGNSLPILAVYNNEWKANDYEVIGDPFFSESSDYDVQITTPLEYRVYATGDEEEKVEQGQRITQIKADQVREFVFAVSSNHRVLTGVTKDNVKVNIYYRYADEEQIKNTLKLSIGMLEYMNQRVGSYPYTELDIFENEMFITGMEYPAMVFVQSKRLNSPAGIQTVLHEVVHQWFYNIVGNDPLNEPWLDEGMATYFTDEFLKKEQLNDFYANESAKLNRTNPNLPIKGVEAYHDWSTYWRSNYRKSSMMIYDLRKQMGETVFDSFIKDYVESYRFDIVSTEQFIQLAEKYKGEDMSSFFSKWMGVQQSP